jgi:hypothetical protein
MLLIYSGKIILRVLSIVEKEEDDKHNQNAKRNVMREYVTALYYSFLQICIYISCEIYFYTHMYIYIYNFLLNLYHSRCKSYSYSHPCIHVCFRNSTQLNAGQTLIIISHFSQISTKSHHLCFVVHNLLLTQ